MFVCSCCNKKLPTRIELIVHTAKCNLEVNCRPRPSSDCEHNRDDIENDPDCPPYSSGDDLSEEEEHEQCRPSSPVTQEQCNVANEVIEMLPDISFEPVSAFNPDSEPVTNSNQSESVSAFNPDSEPVTNSNQSESVSEFNPESEPVTNSIQSESVSAFNPDSEPVTNSNQSESVSEFNPESEPVTNSIQSEAVCNNRQMMTTKEQNKQKNKNNSGVLLPVAEGQAQVSAEVEGILGEIPGNTGIIVVAIDQDGSLISVENLQELVSDNNTLTPPKMDSDICTHQVITPVQSIGGQWVPTFTPKGANQVVHWEEIECQPKENQEVAVSEKQISQAKKRLWQNNDVARTANIHPEASDESVEPEKNPSQKTSTPAVCPYCGVMMQNSHNFTRHLKKKHEGEDSVKVMIKLSKTGGKRREIQKITDSLRKLGRYKYMTKHGSEHPLPAKRPTTENTLLVSCKYCLGAYSAKSFRHHWRVCNQRPTHLNTQTPVSLTSTVTDKKEKESSRQYCDAIPGIKISNDEKFVTAQNVILKTMQMTDIGKQAINDELIVKFAAERLPGVNSDSGKLDYFRNGVRDLSRLLSKIKELDESINNLTDCYDCSKFPIIMKAVHALSETDFLAGTVKKVSFNNRLRTPLGNCGKILLSEARINLKGAEREERITELKHFMDELESKWPKQFGTLAENQMKENRHGKVINCADPEDVSLVFNKCDVELPKAIQTLKDFPTCKNYDTLMKLVALSMFTTSRRRSCDLQKLTVSDFLALQKNKELCEKVGHTLELSQELQDRMSSLYCIFSCGKDQLPTAILLTDKMKSGVECILETQERFGMKPKRIFIRLEKNQRPWKVDLALEWAKKTFNLKDPKNFGIRGIRHLTGTVGQLLTEKDPQIESIFREGLSHSEFVSKRYYRGNLASRLIQGYGLPLIDNMKKTTATCTVTSASLETPSDTVSSSSLTVSEQPSCSLTSELIHEKSCTSDEYHPDTSEEEEWEKEKCSEATSFLETTLEKSKVVRRKWSNEEDCAIVRQFYKIIKMEQRVSGDDIKTAQANEESLKSRTPAEIRSRLSLIRSNRSTGTKLAKIINKLKSPEAKNYGTKRENRK